MKQVIEFLHDNKIPVNKVVDKKKYYIIYNDSSSYLLIPNSNSKKELFQYFKTINYKYFKPIINSSDDKYLLMEYSEDVVGLEYKAKEIINALISLQLSSQFYEDILENDFNNIYNEINNNINYLRDYYLDLQDYIENFSFPRVDYYLLITNVSKFYNALNFSKMMLDKWLNNKKNTLRKSYCIKDLAFDNFVYNDFSYFISYDQCEKDFIIEDISNFIRSNILDINVKELFNYYDSQVNLSLDEKYLLFSLLAIPNKIIFGKSIFDNTLTIRKNIDYLDLIDKFISKEYKENEDTDKNELE